MTSSFLHPRNTRAAASACALIKTNSPMTMALNLPTPMNSLTIFNPDVVKQLKNLTSTKYWWRFSGLRAEGYTDFIKFFDPVLKEFDTLLRELEATEDLHDILDESWVRSIRMELEKEFALLNMMKAHNRNYGIMYTKIKDFEMRRKEQDEKFEKLRHELKELQDEAINFQQKQRQDEVKLESKLTKLENLILTSSTNEKIEEKAKKARKFANKYSYNLKELDYKIQTLREKSEEALEVFEIMETDKIATLVNLWRDTVSNEDRDFKEYKRTAGFLRGGSEVSMEIDPECLISKAIRCQKKSIRLYRFQKSSEMINNSTICGEYFSRSDLHSNVELVSEELEENSREAEEIPALKKGMRKKGNQECFAQDEDQENDVRPFNIDDIEQDTSHGKIPDGVEPLYKQPMTVLSAADETIAPENETHRKTPQGNTVDHEAETTRQSTDVRHFRCEEPSDDEELAAPAPPPRPQPIQVKPTRAKKNGKPQKAVILKQRTADDEDIPSFSGSRKLKSNVEATHVKTLTPAEEVENPMNRQKIAAKSPQSRPSSDTPRTKPEIFSATRAQNNLQTNQKSEDTIQATSHDLRPLPQAPPTCWNEKQHTTINKEKPEKFTPYRVTVVKSYKKMGQNEISVRQGESVKIISRPDDDGYVMAKKKAKFFRRKTGLIPLYTF